jgi:spore germination protein YaaH
MNPFFNANDYRDVFSSVDKLSLMTYDYPNKGAGPNSPLPWMQASVQQYLNVADVDNRIATKILTGLPLYGYKYNVIAGASSSGASSASTQMQVPVAITGPEYIRLLSSVVSSGGNRNRYRNIKRIHFQWHDQTKEHSLSLPDQQLMVYYPTLAFIEDRLKWATQQGIGLSLWECGQGLTYFFDQF